MSLSSTIRKSEQQHIGRIARAVDTADTLAMLSEVRNSYSHRLRIAVSGDAFEFREVYTGVGGAVKHRGGGGKRGAITEFTYASRRNLAWALSRLDFRPSVMTMLSVSDHYTTDGTQFSAAVSRQLRWARDNRHGGRYIWFLEFQKRGAPHVHILFEYPFSDTGRERWCEMWCESVVGWGADDSELGRVYDFHMSCSAYSQSIDGVDNWQVARSIGGLKRYAVKYAMKLEQKNVPDGYTQVGRFWAHSRDALSAWVVDSIGVPSGWAWWAEVATLSKSAYFRQRILGTTAKRVRYMMPDDGSDDVFSAWCAFVAPLRGIFGDGSWSYSASVTHEGWRDLFALAYSRKM